MVFVANYKNFEREGFTDPDREYQNRELISIHPEIKVCVCSMYKYEGLRGTSEVLETGSDKYDNYFVTIVVHMYEEPVVPELDLPDRESYY
ncbi:unnamed protein product [Allacma fusca]|uniref:Uncharacterized protein n=1 Tax=Allacma fusca TaxID=39272 RepID=A0A8J2LH03_9HEXA|nr:unnamed protein product [Allacma fusca]